MAPEFRLSFILTDKKYLVFQSPGSSVVKLRPGSDQVPDKIHAGSQPILVPGFQVLDISSPETNQSTAKEIKIHPGSRDQIGP